MLEIISVMTKFVVPGFCSYQEFIHGRFRWTTLQQGSASGAFFLRTAKPAKSRPSREPTLHFRRPLFQRDRTFAKSSFDGHAQCFSLPQRGENREFLLFYPAEINGVI